MTDRDAAVTDADLHAFVDGELPDERRAAVEAWLAGHPDDAARVAHWRAQAELIRDRFGTVAAEPVPARFDIARLGRPDRRWIGIAAAATVTAFLIGGGSGWIGRGAWDGGAPSRTLTSEALDAHRLYVVEVRHPVEVPAAEAAHLMQWLSKRLGYDLRAPDLGRIGLTLVGGRLLPGPTGAAAAFFMYETASGERFTLYCARSTQPEAALRYRTAGPVAAFYWVDADVAYVVSGPADKDRLHGIAEAAYGQLDQRAGAARRS